MVPVAEAPLVELWKPHIIGGPTEFADCLFVDKFVGGLKLEARVNQGDHACRLQRSMCSLVTAEQASIKEMEQSSDSVLARKRFENRATILDVIDEKANLKAIVKELGLEQFRRLNLHHPHIVEMVEATMQHINHLVVCLGKGFMQLKDMENKTHINLETKSGQEDPTVPCLLLVMLDTGCIIPIPERLLETCVERVKLIHNGHQVVGAKGKKFLDMEYCIKAMNTPMKHVFDKTGVRGSLVSATSTHELERWRLCLDAMTKDLNAKYHAEPYIYCNCWRKTFGQHEANHHAQELHHLHKREQDAARCSAKLDSGTTVDELQKLRDELDQVRNALAQEQRKRRAIEEDRNRLGNQNIDFYIELKKARKKLRVMRQVLQQVETTSSDSESS